MPLRPRYFTNRTVLPDVIARGLSDTLNPLVIPALVFMIIGSAELISIRNIVFLTGIALLFFTLLPLFFALGITWHHSDYTLDFHGRESRTSFYSFTIVSALSGSLLMAEYFDSQYIHLAAVTFIINMIAGFLINLKWKISVHSGAVAVAGLYLLIYGLYGSAGGGIQITGTVLLGIILPLVIWSRYRLGVHSLSELIGGTTAGLLLTAGTFIFVHG